VASAKRIYLETDDPVLLAVGNKRDDALEGDIQIGVFTTRHFSVSKKHITN
jgi:hypothetical protein